MNSNQPSERKKMALYIHGSIRSRMLIPRLLQSVGWNAVITTDEENFLEQAQQLLPDAIIFDDVQAVTQLDHCRRLKTDKRTNHISVIIISYSQEITQEKVTEAGASICLTAPIDIDEFAAIFETDLFA